MSCRESRAQRRDRAVENKDATENRVAGLWSVGVVTHLIKMPVKIIALSTYYTTYRHEFSALLNLTHSGNLKVV